MEKLELTINNKIEVMLNREAFKSNIQDVNDKFFAISIPTKDGEYIPLKAGDLAEVVFYKELSIFQFDSKVLGRKLDGIPVILLEIPEKYTVVQRRQFFRVNKMDYLEIAKLENVEEGYKTTTPTKVVEKMLEKVVLLDISGGGMKIKIKESIQKGDMVHFFLDTKKGQIEIYGKVVRVEIDEFNFNVCGICFLDLTQSEREKIIQYTFEIMRGQRSKGL